MRYYVLLAVALLAMSGCTSTRNARSMRRDGKSDAYGEVEKIISKRVNALIETGDPTDRLEAIALMQVYADIIKLRFKLIDDIMADK